MLKYKRRKGLGGPFVYPGGRVLYYDKAEQKYYDPSTDLYVLPDEIMALKQSFMHLISANYTPL